MKKIVQIDVKELKEGMQLATDAIDDHGVCLLSVGSFLNKNTIEGLSRRPIGKVSIYHFEQLSQQQINDCISNIQAELDSSFRQVEAFPGLNLLKQIFFDYRTKDLKTDND